MYKFIEYEKENGVATLWLNRPEKRNCINWEMLNEMAEVIEKAENDDEVRALVVRGRGDTFCAGA
ncbi:enoyl-CoA hydratase/isomerase family protein, partial [Alteribacillus sp. YIM 98480]|uniref:enoyl-CoA hydratase/isomerase family protein n=1 Tax=Alteribacillus sp. YIM 98480 TaxID=2606599 RepID=UPI0018EF1A95